ncbi:MAG: MBL fold metallo-hydrolase [Candidatus Latescibacterota bacterium]|nr:MAG: MBL fold metallo-hydrolase [Candidatus Latescibacterota bacterium]
MSRSRMVQYDSKTHRVINVHSLKVGVGWTHLIETASGLVLVDAGSPGKQSKMFRYLEKLGRDDLRLIIITHAHLDHYGSALAIGRSTDAPIAIHREDADAMAKAETHLGLVRGWGKFVERTMPLVERYLSPEPTQADLLLGDGERLDRFGLDAQILHTPGHTPGSLTLLVDGGLAFVGDLASTRGRPHAQLFYATDWAQLERSLKRVQSHEPRWVYTGHGGRPIRGEVFQRIKARRV